MIYALSAAVGIIAALLVAAVVWKTRITPANLSNIKQAASLEAQNLLLTQKEADLNKQAADLHTIAKDNAEKLKKEAIMEAKDEAYRMRAEVEREIRDKRAEQLRLERRLTHKEETLDHRLEQVEKKETTLAAQLAAAEALIVQHQQTLEAQQQELQRVSGLTPDEAKQIFLKSVEEEARHEAAQLYRDIEEQARQDADRRASEIVVDAIQRCAVEQVTETTVSVVPLPTDEMKGRIIGREGRNIRAFELETGVDLVIDDTPEAVVLSCFDPIRREIARVALTNLIADGRIHPARIEEAVQKAAQEVDRAIWEAGESAVLDTGITGLSPDLVRLMGKLKYRTSYGQNMLSHSVEVAHLCGVLAAELRVNVQLAKRAGLLHDIGKAMDHEEEQPHAMLTIEILKRHGEPADVVNAAGSHHHDTEPNCIEAHLVIIADGLSAARPGARREMLETYVKRLDNLEKIANSFEGVESSYAVQAGREMRLIVKPDLVDDLGALRMAREIAHRIESEMEFPGQIKVTVIRETRATEYAK